MAALKQVQVDNKRSRIRFPKPGVVTRWNSEIGEVTSSNIMMSDLNAGLNQMCCVGGIDEDLLTDSAGDLVDRTELMYTLGTKRSCDSTSVGLSRVCICPSFSR